MNKAYLAISYSNRKIFEKEVKTLIELCKANDIELLSFVDTYKFKKYQGKKMMDTAFVEIEKTDFIIAELTTKSIGVGIEVGYAKAKGKPIVYLHKNGSEFSSTAFGSADYHVAYADEVDLKESMGKLLKQLTKTIVNRDY